jgi:hypothetical protein
MPDGVDASAVGRGQTVLRTTRHERETGTSRATRRERKLLPATFFNRPSDRRGHRNTGGRNMRSRCRCSMCPAIHINSRSWLRSSSTHEPSDPPLRVVSSLRRRPVYWPSADLQLSVVRGRAVGRLAPSDVTFKTPYVEKTNRPSARTARIAKRYVDLCERPPRARGRGAAAVRLYFLQLCRASAARAECFGNDPSAGSPTETLLRLLLPRNNQV